MQSVESSHVLFQLLYTVRGHHANHSHCLLPVPSLPDNDGGEGARSRVSECDQQLGERALCRRQRERTRVDEKKMSSFRFQLHGGSRCEPPQAVRVPLSFGGQTAEQSFCTGEIGLESAYNGWHSRQTWNIHRCFIYLFVIHLLVLEKPTQPSVYFLRASPSPHDLLQPIGQMARRSRVIVSRAKRGFYKARQLEGPLYAKHPENINMNNSSVKRLETQSAFAQVFLGFQRVLGTVFSCPNSRNVAISKASTLPRLSEQLQLFPIQSRAHSLLRYPKRHGTPSHHAKQRRKHHRLTLSTESNNQKGTHEKKEINE